MYFLGLDVGSSSVKAALVESESGKSVLSVHEPKNEMSISSIKNDWADKTLICGGNIPVLQLKEFVKNPM